MPFLPSNQQRQSTEGKKGAQYVAEKLRDAPGQCQMFAALDTLS